MTSPHEMVKDFRAAMDRANPSRPQQLDEKTTRMHLTLILEEVAELASASGFASLACVMMTYEKNLRKGEVFFRIPQSADLVKQADALADLEYVTHYFALAAGIPLDRVFKEVHRSNMTKRGPDGKVHLREDGKILKPPTYEPPDIKAILDSCR